MEATDYNIMLNRPGLAAEPQEGSEIEATGDFDGRGTETKQNEEDYTRDIVPTDPPRSH